MTVISEAVASVAGADNNTQFEIAYPDPRPSSDGGTLLTTPPLFLTAVDGVLTTPSLDPGWARVRVGQRIYYVQIPDWPDASPIQLSPLLDVATPIPPAHAIDAVRNGGGVARIQRITEAAYAALTTPDPETLYVVVEA